jgi:hypothetical protein
MYIECWYILLKKYTYIQIFMYIVYTLICAIYTKITPDLMDFRPKYLRLSKSIYSKNLYY